MTESRLFVPERLGPGRAIELDAERTNYLLRVLRRKPGDRVICFDGEGDAYACKLTRGGRSAGLVVEERTLQSTAPAFRLHVGLGLIKGASMDRALQQCAELGASDIWLIDAARSNVKLDQRRANNKDNHWNRVLQSSAEQCGTLRVPCLHPPRKLAALLESAPAETMALHTLGDRFPAELATCDRMVLIGPEGGWDEAELGLFESRGIPCYALGSLTFRAETAPSVALALIQQAQGWL